jgi:uncharacterized membrane protein
MPLGPIELLVISFPGNQFTGEITPALAELVESGTIRIVDLLFVIKDEQGKVAVLELGDLAADVLGQFRLFVSDTIPMLNDEDAYELAEALENNSSAGIMLFENTWATRFADAIHNAKGEVVLNERIPRAAIEELIAATA